MDILKKERTVLRSVLTKGMNDLDTLLKSSPEYIEAQTRFEVVLSKFQDLQIVEKKIYGHLLEGDLSEEEIAIEVEKADNYVSKFTNLKLRFLNLKSSVVQDTDAASVLSSPRRKFKLPKIEFKKFSGDIKEWLPFWNQFQKIDEDEDIDPSDKIQYLYQATVPNSPARRIVESFPAIDGNYDKIISLFKARFGRDELQIEVYVRELLKLIIKNACCKREVKIAVLYDNIETQLRSLETLGITTDKCTAMLFPLVESCLPEEVLRIWQRSQTGEIGFLSTESSKDDLESGAGVSGPNRLESLLSFLKKEVENEQRIALAAESLGITEVTPNLFKSRNRPRAEDIPTASGLINCEAEKCIFCGGTHLSCNCYKARKMTLSDRKEVINKTRSCFKCLKGGHVARRCRERVTCLICQKGLFALLCPDLDRPPESKEPQKKEGDPPAVCLANYSRNHVFLQTLKVVVSGPLGSRQVRALIDSASQHSYILTNTARSLGLPSVGAEKVVHGLFGGVCSAPRDHCLYEVKVSGSGNALKFKMLSENVICTPVTPIFSGPWHSELKKNNIKILDLEPGPIEILFGADAYPSLDTGKRFKLSCGLLAVNTVFGWTLIGGTDTPDIGQSLAAVSLSLFSKEISCLWDLDSLGIKEPCAKKSREESALAAHDFFLQTTTRNEEGRYEVRLPWLFDHPPLPDNFSLAKKRVEISQRKMSYRFKEEYEAVFREWLAEGIIEEVESEDKASKVHYLPHRPVVKEGLTTRVRPVFDASARMKDQPSLNDCLEKGLNLELIPNILIKFRLRKFGIVSDIRKAFLQVSVHPADRDCLRFLWMDSENNLKIFRHRRVVFGVSSSPFLLGSTIKFHLNRCMVEATLPNSRFSKKSVEILAQSFYVDNLLSSLDDASEIEPFISDATMLMADGKFELRGWEFTGNPPSCGKYLSVLGLNWNPIEDTLFLNSRNEMLNDDEDSKEEEQIISKRYILSVISRIFDPIGFCCPATLIPKLILQKTWEGRISWDSPVPPELCKIFQAWTNDVHLLQNVRIPRWIRGSAGKISLHTFSDASKDAYATAIFLRVEEDDKVFISLLAAKSRVAPLKKISIPRLELLAATISARLFSSIKDNFGEVESYFWTDSSTVLSWIKRTEEWSTFVWNRVKEIRTMTSTDSWNHVPGALNPADLPSRGCTPRQLLQSKWWEGPSWLYERQELWPANNFQCDEEQISAEKKKKIIHTMVNAAHVDWHLGYFSKYIKTVRMIAYVLRFIHFCKTKDLLRGPLSLEEIDKAEKFILKVVQTETFSGQDLKMGDLRPFLDPDGLLRVKSRITCRKDAEDFLYPILLPAKHFVVESLVMYYHESSCHVGTQGLLCSLRERFWIIGGRRSVRSIINRCLVCRRHKAKHFEVVPAPLPVDRVRDARAFEVVGVDFAIPLYLKSQQKVYVCLFTCAVYRAVHLELTTSLSTAGFLQVLRRFIARRGRPHTIYSDNGTNFVGAENAFSKVDWAEISNFSTAQRIAWKFNPPTAAWWGGFWERMIGTLKQLLRKVLGRACLHYEELMTVLCDCEAVINSRPLTYVSEVSTDFSPLTPSMFIQDLREVGVPECDAVDSLSLQKRVKYLHSLRQALRQRFRLEYLGLLRTLTGRRPTRPICIGEMVLIGSDNSKRMDWPIGRVEELITGKDGVVRLVRVYTPKGSLFRPVQRLYPLEVISDGLQEATNPETTSPDATNPETTSPDAIIPDSNSTLSESAGVFKSRVPVSRSGRVLRRPKWLDD